ncbi:MAG: DUF1553 domain-containing protein [Acidobacteria bacterium]|nr:DUF1553 domain-containing protein [Acidobacteriota bacterium]MBI3427594.1 DUF1553 domain-containing protein [Acidobacteriota bacterium]
MHTFLRRQSLRSFCVLFVAISAVAQQTATYSPSAIQFNRDVRPILAEKCFVCHGPDATAKKIRLRLDTEAAAKAELSRGRRAIVPGQPEQSELVKRITHANAAMRMPPADAGRTLTPREIATLTEWTRQGAHWETHWAFVPPIRPALPAVKNSAWPKNAIDYFVLARLEREGVQPAPAAERATLLRRLSFDLTGLPPTVPELDAFLNDTAPNAYETIVDRLLASPRYGERMAFKWLDAARYADTNGYQNDGDREMWRWRDWVIEAFNQNMPFDQFTIEQLGGDLLPNPTLNQRLATGFNRNHRQNSEDGLVPEEYAVEYVVDRVDTTSTVFLGLTLGCARCHNHKYDPFTQQEYYRLYAYFNSIREDGRSAYHNSPPFLYAPTREQQAQAKKLQAQLAQAEQNLQQLTQQHAATRRHWERSLSAVSTPQQWFPSENLLFRHSLGAQAQGEILLQEKARVTAGYAAIPIATANTPPVLAFRAGTPTHTTVPAGEATIFDGQLFYEAGRIGNFDYQDRLVEHRDQFAVSLWFYAESENAGALLTKMQEVAGETENGVPKTRGYGLFLLNDKLHWNAVSAFPDDAWRVETAEAIPLKQWHHVVALFDGRENYERAQIYLDGRKQTLKPNLTRIFRTFADSSATLKIGAGGGPELRFKGQLSEVRLYQALPGADDIAVLACAEALPKIAALPTAQRSTAQRLKLLNAWQSSYAPAEVRQAYRQRAAARLALLQHERTYPLVMVMDETAAPRPAHILRRGAYDAPGEIVPRGLPAALCAPSTTPPANRLEFARWLVSAANPLTARVTVNRFWQMLFGTGLVKTIEDFGAQGELPSHPELLDWLAVELRMADCGWRIADCSQRQPNAWNIKRLLKTIVMSATYRQSSKRAELTNPQSSTLQGRNPQSDDPDNRLLARGPRLRLPAEMIRDQALFVAGLLVEKQGGPSVKPYQPAGLLKDMVFSNMTDYAQAQGADLWRRSLYTYWKRTVLNPSMQVFDATAREQCTVRETRTNTPLQALNLMNDVTYVEAARLLAERMLLAGGATPQQRLAWAFRAVTSRQPDADELQMLQKSLGSQLDYFRQQPQAAEKLLLIGQKRNNATLNAAELAAYTMTASLLLNLDEAITKP